MRRRLLLAPLMLAAGCRTAETVPCLIEQQVQAVAAARAEAGVVPCSAEAPAVAPARLTGLWQLALRHNPTLREAAADVEIARGRLIQAGAYPNPRVVYQAEEVGASEAPKGNHTVEVLQEIVTAGKRRLDVDAAGRGLDAASVALLGRKYDALTRLRRAYYEFQALALALQVSREVAASLEQGVALTRQLVEEVKNRPRTDLVRLEALLEQARINVARGQTSVDAAWKQVAAEVGLPSLPMPPAPPLPERPPGWTADFVTGRVLSANTDLTHTALEAERARLEYERARAEAVPNVTVGAGYNRSFVDEAAGAAFTVETVLPIWDQKKGLIHERRARWAQAEAARRTAWARLSREAAEAFGRYEAARTQAERQGATVLPKLEEALRLVREGYRAGARDLNFADVLLAQEALNEARSRLAEVRRELWRAVADLQGLMQLDICE